MQPPVDQALLFAQQNTTAFVRRIHPALCDGICADHPLTGMEIDLVAPNGDDDIWEICTKDWQYSYQGPYDKAMANFIYYLEGK